MSSRIDPRHLILSALCLFILPGLSGCGDKRGPEVGALEAEPAPEKSRGGQPAQSFSGTGGPYALLVGCTTYDNLDKRFHLEGPGNDVILMRQVLRDRFGFPDKNIVTLSEAVGGAHRPTRANIEREFRRLGEIVKKGDQVVILLGGHGSQQPDQFPSSPDDLEPDGLDETFLPADVGKWDGGKEVVPNAILDDDLRRWTKAILDKGAALFTVVDACHSGTVLRGSSEEVEREVAPEALVPREALEKARKRAAEFHEKTRGAPAEETSPFKLIAGSLVALYAAQSIEPTVERPMPMEGADRKRHGLLTYTMCQILTQARAPLTYRELAQRIHKQYVHWGRTSPTPLIEGTDLDREVLGTKKWPGRSRFVLAADGEGGWKVNGGSLHGLTERSILAVYPPAGQETDKPVGHVRIVKSRSLDAEVQPCEHAKMPAPKKLPEGGRCEPVYLDLGSLRIRVAVGAVPDAERKPLEEALKKLAAEEGSLLELVPNSSQAAWIIQPGDGKLFLVPAEGISAGKGTASFVLARDRVADDLRTYLGRISRAQNLLSVASASTGELARGGSAPAASTVDVEVVLLKLRDKSDPKGEPVAWQNRGVTLAPGDFIAFRATNKGKVAVDVTLLFIDSGFGIDAAFPRPGTTTDNRLPPGGSFQTPPARVSPRTTGLEHIVVIATEANGPPLDFTLLRQPTIERAGETATRGRDAKQVLDSPLGRLFQNALYARGTTRGLDMDVVDDHQLRLLSWQVLPAKKEAEKK